MLGADTFLINPRNRPFVEGRASKPIAPPSLPGCIVIFMLPFIAVGLYTIAMALNEWYNVGGYALASRPAEALVTGKEIVSGDDSDSYYLVYRYNAAAENGGGRHTGRDSVGLGEYQRIEVEDTLQVEYVAFDPGRSRIAGRGSGLGEAGFATFFTIFWNAITWTMTFFVLYSRVWSRRLSKGSLLHGTLTDCETSLDSDNDLQLKIGYNFFTPSGLLIKGTYQGMHNEFKGTSKPDPGTPVAVLYADEKTHTLL